MNLPRRWWVTLAALGVGCLALRAGAAFQEREARLPRAPIDRQALVSRHDPVLRELDVEAPLSVGNGEFEFTADITGLQTFAEPYDATIPLATLSQWAWHTAPNPNGWRFCGSIRREWDASRPTAPMPAASWWPSVSARSRARW